MPPADGHEVSEETRMLIESLRVRAAQAPGAVVLADLLALPRDHRAATEDDIRRLGARAIEQAQQMSYLLGKLAVLAGDDRDGVP
jgi:hypothetical protein